MALKLNSLSKSEQLELMVCAVGGLVSLAVLVHLVKGVVTTPQRSVHPTVSNGVFERAVVLEPNLLLATSGDQSYYVRLSRSEYETTEWEKVVVKQGVLTKGELVKPLIGEACIPVPQPQATYRPSGRLTGLYLPREDC
jgi:hypothetical protein